MLFVRLGNSWRKRMVGVRRSWSSRRLLNSPLDFTNAFEVIADSAAVLRSDFALKVGHLRFESIENAGVLPARHGLAEQSIERPPRIDFDRKWSCRRTP